MRKTGHKSQRPKRRKRGANRGPSLLPGADPARSEAFRRQNRTEEGQPQNDDLAVPYSDPWVSDPQAPAVPPEHDID